MLVRKLKCFGKKIFAIGAFWCNLHYEKKLKIINQIHKLCTQAIDGIVNSSGMIEDINLRSP